MKVACCYRLIPHGEVMHSKYDTDTLTVEGLPKDWYDVSILDLPEYSSVHYHDCKSRFDEMVETVLMSDSNYALVIECCNFGYYVLDFAGNVRFLKSSIEQNQHFSTGPAPDTTPYVAVGYRRTKQRQLRNCDGVFRLVMDVRTGCVITADGVLKLGVERNRLSKPDYHYAGYKKMMSNDLDYAVVYIDDEPVFLAMDKTETMLIQY